MDSPFHVVPSPLRCQSDDLDDKSITAGRSIPPVSSRPVRALRYTYISALSSGWSTDVLVAMSVCCQVSSSGWPSISKAAWRSLWRDQRRFADALVVRI